jgi:hypothetical protein
MDREAPTIMTIQTQLDTSNLTEADTYCMVTFSLRPLVVEATKIFLRRGTEYGDCRRPRLEKMVLENTDSEVNACVYSKCDSERFEHIDTATDEESCL